MRRSARRKEACLALVFLLLTGLMIHFISDVLRPPQVSFGSTWSAFLAEPEDSLDVIYLGSSYTYCDVNPAVIYDQSGLTGYVMAGSEQTLSISYWYLREIFRTQSPSAVVVEVTSLFFEPYQNYTQLNVDLMPFSFNKLGAIFTASEPELRTGLLFDLYFYHSRWKEVEREDVERALHPVEWNERKGFTPMAGTQEGVGQTPYVADRIISDEHYADNLKWLGRILALCREHDAQAILTIHPSYTRCTPERYAQIGREVAQMDDQALFYDWSDSFEEMGLTPSRHLYDGGHLNREGAGIFSAWLGDFLVEEVGLTPRPQSEENAAAWRASVAWWENEAAEQ